MCSPGVPGAAEAGWNAQPQDTAALAVASACGVTLLLLGNVLLLSLPTPSHSPPGCQRGGCFAWGLPWLQALSWRRALFPQSPNAVSVWTHVLPPHLALLQTQDAWDISESGAKGKAFPPALVVLWWPFPQPSCWFLLGGCHLHTPICP